MPQDSLLALGTKKQVDETNRVQIRGGIELVREARLQTVVGKRTFPDHASYLQYLRGRNYTRGNQ
jgi:hypothetical protein